MKLGGMIRPGRSRNKGAGTALISQLKYHSLLTMFVSSAMNTARRRFHALRICAVLMSLVGCNQHANEARPDSPRLTPKVAMRDVTFHSVGLNRDMQYRVIFPANMTAGEKWQAVYLLHGGGGGFRDWSNYSDVARFAESGLILIMPEGDSSYFTNAADLPRDRYEDYIVTDLISDVENRLPVATGRTNRAIVGVSMGGFGAVKLALRHPDLFAFTGGLSPAIDVPSRPFSVKRMSQWRRFRAIFGPWEGQTQRDNDPFVLARSADPARTPYFFLSCGEQEGLLAPNREFAAELGQRHFQYEFHTAPGDHNWNQWNARLPSLFQSLSDHYIKADTKY
jgi:putative tributyrin esterase